MSVDVDEVDKHIEREPPTARDISVSWRYLNDSFSKPLTEIVFSYPGQGYLLLQAVRAQDFPLMQGLFMTITFAVLAANWMVDIAILFFDPRTRK